MTRIENVICSKPAVSIVIASYNRLSLLESAVGSALAQDYPNYEVLVVDDGSDEETRAWLQAAEQRNARLRVVFQEHQGVAAVRARGVVEAHADFICILDSDDMLMPHALRRMTEELQRHRQANLFHTAIRELRPNGVEKVQPYRVFTSTRAMLWATLAQPRVPFKHSGTLFRRSTAIELGSYDSDLPCKVDIDLYLKFLMAGHCPRLIPEPLVQFRMHKNSVSRNRLFGVRVWFGLIDRYGPRNPALRFGIKLARAVSELLKWVYLEVKG